MSARWSICHIQQRSSWLLRIFYQKTKCQITLYQAIWSKEHPPPQGFSFCQMFRFEEVGGKGNLKEKKKPQREEIWVREMTNPRPKMRWSPPLTFNPWDTHREPWKHTEDTNQSEKAKAWWSLSLPQTSRANPVQCYSTHQENPSRATKTPPTEGGIF